ncbi:MAG: hypothetical protein RL375_3225 [Pseudomonadota bacterium]|jgi:CheY-like chemotaxis protein
MHESSSKPVSPVDDGVAVLIVDDQPEIRRLLSISLGKEYRVLEAVDGVSAIEQIRRHRPKAVFLDVMMPGGLDGLQVLDEIKRSPETRSTIVAMLTARGQVTDFEEARRRGADAYFTKPFSPLKVISWIRESLGDGSLTNLPPTDFGNSR